jgi:hypothetical protein
MALLFRSLARLAAFLVAVEMIFFAYGSFSMSHGNPFRLYSQSRLEQQIADHLSIETSALLRPVGKTPNLVATQN